MLIYLFIDIGISVDPESVSICEEESATFNCRYFHQFALIPLWRINGTLLLSMEDIVNDTNNLGLKWIFDGNDTNTTRLLVGAVSERFIGRTTFQCEIPALHTRRSQSAILTVIG